MPLHPHFYPSLKEKDKTGLQDAVNHLVKSR